ncbi:MAG: hypothetical protein R2758_10650 [Bacteroidales bacterium]
MIRYYGQETLGKYVESRYDLAARFAEAIRRESDMELAVTPSQTSSASGMPPAASPGNSSMTSTEPSGRRLSGVVNFTLSRLNLTE